MKFPKIGAVALVAALALAAFALAVTKSIPVDQPATAAGPAASSGRSPEAAAVEAAIARTSLARRLEEALGDGFGGVWFEPSTAQVQVGITSPESRSAAEEVASRLDLEETVIATRVRSSWTELAAAQDRWNLYLRTLLDPDQFSTSLKAEQNSVQLELTSSVSPGRRLALEERAAAASIGTIVEVAPSARFRVTPLARCQKFVSFKAHCDPALVSGTSLKEEAEEEKGGDGTCTTGPVLVNKNRETESAATETFVITAGHCLEEEPEIPEKWYTFTTEAEKKEIGDAIARLDGEHEVDAGIIKVESNFWANSKDVIPVAPTITRSNKEEESDPFSVVAEETPMENTKVCLSGQRSAVQCGEITATKKFLIGLGDMAVVALETGKIGHGDSGAPVYLESPYKNESKGYVEGILIGGSNRKEEEEGVEFETAYFQPLYFSLPVLDTYKEVDLELLTDANKIRHPIFTAEEYPTTLTGEDGSEDKFTAFGATITCKQRSFDGPFEEPETEEILDSIELKPSYSECTEDKGRPVKITVNECKYKITLSEKVKTDHYKGELALICPEGKPGIEFHFYPSHEDETGETNPCEMTMPPQSGLQSLTLTNSEEKVVIDKGTVGDIKFEIESEDCYCPGARDDETAAGIYHLAESLVITGEFEEEEIAIDMAGGWAA